MRWMVLLSLLLISAERSGNSDPSDFTVKKIAAATDFQLFVPSESSLKMEVKVPYPLNTKGGLSLVRLHCFNSSGRTYLFGLEQHRANGYKYERKFVTMDVRTKKSTTEVKQEVFRFDTRGAPLAWEGVDLARFEPWANGRIPGGYRDGCSKVPFWRWTARA